MTIDKEHVKRYKDIAKLLFKYGRRDFKNLEPDEFVIEDKPEENGEHSKPADFAADLEKMGPTFIKLGQLLSTRADFLPPSYIAALSRLQDNVEPFPYEQVEEIVQSELGVRISKAFSEFSTTPLAAASLGQVHYARLRDGREVAVKVQRPNIKKTIVDDLSALKDIAETMEKHTQIGQVYSPTEILAEFKKTILLELDYLQEARNLIKMGNILADYQNILIPRPINDYSTQRVLTMEFISGVKATSLSPVAKIEFDGTVLAEELFKAYLDQVLIHGFFHADPHPGNVFITPDRKIALIDLGMTANVDPVMRENILKLLLFVSENRGDDAASVSIQLSTPMENFDEANYRKQVSEFVAAYQDASLERIKVGTVVVELTRLATENHLKASPALTMLGKTLLNLDEIGRTLAPQFNPNKVIQSHAEYILRRHILKEISPGNLFSSVLELKEFIKKFPERLNTLFDALINNKFQVRVDALDEVLLSQNMQKVANRITTGLVLAALIIGAAMLMRVETDFTILGYPGLAMILFLVAAMFGLGLVINIMLNDREINRRKRPPAR